MLARRSRRQSPIIARARYVFLQRAYNFCTIIGQYDFEWYLLIFPGRIGFDNDRKIVVRLFVVEVVAKASFLQGLREPAGADR